MMDQELILPDIKPEDKTPEEYRAIIKDLMRQRGLLSSDLSDAKDHIKQMQSEIDAYRGDAARFTSASAEYQKLMRDVADLKTQRDNFKKENDYSEEVWTLIIQMYDFIKDKFASAKFLKGLPRIQTNPEMRKQLTNNLDLLDTWLAEMRQVVDNLPEMKPEEPTPEELELPFE